MNKLNNLAKIAICMIFIFLILFINCNVVNAEGVNGTTIVLNAGHGGKYTGCANGAKKLVEKDLTLKIAYYLRDYLNQYYGVKVILTHDGKTFPNNDAGDLAARAMVARNNNAELYVSLHIDDTDDKNVQGATVYTTSRTELPKYKEGMTKLGNMILVNLNKLGIKNNGVVNNKLCNDKEPKYQYYDGSQADFYGDIRHAMKGDTEGRGPDFRDGSGVPAVLIEHCYINNSHDVEYLDSDEDLKKLAQADGAAIVEYFGLKLPKDVITSMSIDKTSINLLEGKSSKINVSVGPESAPNKKVIWTSSNKDIVEVDDDGNITAVSTGKATITVTSEVNPNISKQVTVNVEKEEVKFEDQNSNVIVGREKTLNVKISPSWIDNKNIIWESDNKDIKVTQDGKIIAEKEGEAIIKVTWQDKNLSDEIKITAVELSDDTYYEIINYKEENNYISKIGEKVSKESFIENIKISDDLRVEIDNKEVIGTGTKVKIVHKQTGIVLDEYTCIIYGDVNGDGEITPADYVRIKNHIMKVSSIVGTYTMAADVDQNKEITPADYVRIKNHIMRVKLLDI